MCILCITSMNYTLKRCATYLFVVFCAICHSYDISATTYKPLPYGYMVQFMRLTEKRPLKGYVVFMNDTISGMLKFTYEYDSTLSESDAKLSTKRTMLHIDGPLGSFTIRIGDANLSFISLTDDKNRMLQFGRVCSCGFGRAVHIGKLSVYDRRYKLSYRQNLHVAWYPPVLSTPEKCIDIMYDPDLKLFHWLHKKKDEKDHTKAYIIKKINECYNLHLDPKKYRARDLSQLISSLD